MTRDEIQAVLSKISYKPGWTIELYSSPVEHTFRLSWFDNCSITGKKELQLSREWYIPQDATEDFIIRTVFRAIQSAEEHETKEKFKYMGKRIFNPHLTVKNLLEVCELEDNV